MFMFTSKRQIEEACGPRAQTPRRRARFIVQFHYLGLDCIQLGFHVCCSLPNIEIHFPFGFLRIGRVHVGRTRLSRGFASSTHTAPRALVLV